MIRIVSRFLLLSGFAALLWSGFLTYKFYAPGKNLFPVDRITLEHAVATLSKKPLTFAIPSLSIELPVVPGRIEGSQWAMTRQGISYLETSPVPGQQGNSIFYGHNDRSLLGNLTKAKPGQVVRIGFDDGTRQDFVVDLTGEVTPKQTEILQDAGDTRLTIFTCSGLFDQKRFVVIATPVGDAVASTK